MTFAIAMLPPSFRRSRCRVGSRAVTARLCHSEAIGGSCDRRGPPGGGILPSILECCVSRNRIEDEEDSMGYKIDEIEGIGPSYADKLGKAAIKSTDDLLKLCCSPKGRKEVAAKTGVAEAMLLKWSNHADLMRISGIGPEYAELLEAAGVDTVKELRTRNAENLAAKMTEINEQKKLTRANPSNKAVTGWVDAAKSMEPMISH
jgi:predicted flap endonuclease-1-like 5' DNA nuclease